MSPLFLKSNRPALA